MTDLDHLLDSLAALVEYPDAEFNGALRRCCGVAGAVAPETAARLASFGDEVGVMPLARLQEAYIDAFDLDPACALDVGWHLHGERRERGELLALLRERLRAAGVTESTQLPDHLTHVLMLLARQPADERAALAADCTVSLDHVREALRRRASPYAALIDAVHSVVAGCAAPGKGQIRG